MHYSGIAEGGSLYQNLEHAFDETGGQVVVDFAFSNLKYPFLIQSAQEETSASVAGDVVKIGKATYARHASEWCMSGIQGSFPHLKDRFIC